MLPRVILTFTLADSLRNGLQEKGFVGIELVMQFLDHHRLCYGYFMVLHSFLNLWFWNIPIRLSFNVWPSLVDGDEQGIATRVPAIM